MTDEEKETEEVKSNQIQKKNKYTLQSIIKENDTEEFRKYISSHACKNISDLDLESVIKMSNISMIEEIFKYFNLSTFRFFSLCGATITGDFTKIVISYYNDKIANETIILQDFLDFCINVGKNPEAVRIYIIIENYLKSKLILKKFMTSNLHMTFAITTHNHELISHLILNNYYIDDTHIDLAIVKKCRQCVKTLCNYVHDKMDTS